MRSCIGCSRLSRWDGTLGRRIYDGLISKERVPGATQKRQVDCMNGVDPKAPKVERLAFYLCQVCAYLFDNDTTANQRIGVAAALRRHTPPEAWNGWMK